MEAFTLDLAIVEIEVWTGPFVAFEKCFRVVASAIDVD
jgi:hypothetical protein